MIKLIIFDFDGTLVDSKKLYIDTIHHHLLMNYFIFTKSHVAKALGPKLEITLKNLKKFDPKTLKKLKQDINDFIAKKTSELKLCPKAKQTLKELKKRKIKIALLTNSARKFAILFLKKHKLAKYFNKLLCAEDFDNKERAIKELIKEFNITKKETVYVADRIKDIKIAKNVGCKIIIVLACSWDKKFFKKRKAKFIIKDLEQLKNEI